MQGRENRLNGLVPPPTAASRSASRSLGPLRRSVHVERLALELLAIGPPDRRRGFAAIGNPDDPKPANFALNLVLIPTPGVDLPNPSNNSWRSCSVTSRARLPTKM